jgi:aspartate 1-decarboxylase
LSERFEVSECVPSNQLKRVETRAPERRGRKSLMQIHILKSKIHRAIITGASLNYEGSLTVDLALMEKVGLLPYERVLCSNLDNGQRFETYLIGGEHGSGDIVLNGATAHLGKAGDLLTIMSFTFIEEADAQKWEPRVIVLGARNAIINHRGIQRC